MIYYYIQTLTISRTQLPSSLHHICANRVRKGSKYDQKPPKKENIQIKFTQQLFHSLSLEFSRKKNYAKNQLKFSHLFSIFGGILLNELLQFKKAFNIYLFGNGLKCFSMWGQKVESILSYDKLSVLSLKFLNFYSSISFLKSPIKTATWPKNVSAFSWLVSDQYRLRIRIFKHDKRRFSADSCMCVILSFVCVLIWWKIGAADVPRFTVLYIWIWGKYMHRIKLSYTYMCLLLAFSFLWRCLSVAPRLNLLNNVHWMCRQNRGE